MPITCVLNNTLAMVCQKLYDLRKSLFLVILAITAILKVNAQCKADFSYNIDFNTGFVSFINQSTLANSNLAVTYTWYSNPAIVLSNDTNPVIRLKPGTQPICLIVDNAGCLDTFCTSIIMPPVHCKARYEYSFDFTMDTVSFTNNSSGLNLSYYWSFGDGNYSTDAQPKHRFAINGWYYVCLNVVNSDTTCTDVTCEFVRINRISPSPCVGGFSFETDTVDSYKVHFTNTTVGDTGITYVWLFGDTTTSNQKEPFHRFDTVGKYKVCLLVSGPNCADSVCKEVEIINIIPFCKAGFTYELFPDSGNNTPRIGIFTNTSVGSNLKYLWTLGDSALSSETSPIHYFKLNGTYKVCLSVNSGVLCTDSVCKLISIQTGLAESAFLSEMNVYPIPTQGELIIDFAEHRLKDVQLVIHDVLGNEKTLAINNRNNQIILDTSNLANGLYIVEVKTNTEIKTIKFLK